MNVVPPAEFKQQVRSTETAAHAVSNAAPALPDTLREQNGGCLPIATTLNEQHPLQHHLQNFDQTARNTSMEQYRQIFGIAEPMKRVMELEIVQKTDFNPLNENHVHSDILLNKDTSIEWEDVYNSGINDNIHRNVMLGDWTHETIEKSVGL